MANLETRLGHSEALVRQLRAQITKLRAELADERLKNGTHSSASSSDSRSPTNGNPQSEFNALEGHRATLHILRAALHALSAPPPPPHAEDLVDAELERMVRV